MKLSLIILAMLFSTITFAEVKTYIEVDCKNRDLIDNTSYRADGKLIRVDGEKIIDSMDVTVYHESEILNGFINILTFKDNACTSKINVSKSDQVELEEVLGSYSVVFHINLVLMTSIDSFMDGSYKSDDSNISLLTLPQNLKEFLRESFGGYGITCKNVKYTYTIE